MMNRRNPDRIFRWAGALVPALAALMSVGLAQSGQRADLAMALKGPFNLGAARTAEVHYFRMITQFIHIGFDGKRTGVETYTLTLKCVPAALAAQDGDAYTCRDFRLRFNDAPEATIPALAGWTHLFKPGGTGTGEAGQVFGIPHAKFENLVDSRGRKLPVGIGYAVCNSFIDFHAFNDVFARPTEGGKGIQDLTEIGQRIVHAAAFTEPPVNLGSGIKTGSVFRNGEVTLEFKGLGLVDGAACGVVGYDSGESTLKMIMPMGAEKDIVTEGGSEYMGDLYVDLATRWVRKVTMGEFVVTRTLMPGPGAKIDAYTVRHLQMRMLSRAEFEKD